MLASGNASPTVHVNQLKYTPPRSTHLLKQTINILPTKDPPKVQVCDIFADLTNIRTRNLVDDRAFVEGAGSGENMGNSNHREQL